jgi:uncharacterized protein YggE
MKKSLIACLAVLLAAPAVCRAQVSGNIAFLEGGGKARAEQNERQKRVLTEHELPPTGTSMFVEANVLMNVRADEYVAVFGVLREGESVAQCVEKMAAAIEEFSAALGELGIGEDDLFVDFVAQNKIYGFEIIDDIAREKLVGFELKKNVLIRLRDKGLLDQLVAAAARLEIFDLIKVDYVVKDIGAINDRLVREAARVIKQKASRYADLLAIELGTPAQVYAERPSVYYPSELYDSYTAFESEAIGAAFARQKYTTQTARKSRTFFFNPLDADGFDHVVNPVVTEPVVQCTLHLKVKYEVREQNEMSRDGPQPRYLAGSIRKNKCTGSAAAWKPLNAEELMPHPQSSASGGSSHASTSRSTCLPKRSVARTTRFARTRRPGPQEMVICGAFGSGTIPAACAIPAVITVASLLSRQVKVTGIRSLRMAPIRTCPLCK